MFQTPCDDNKDFAILKFHAGPPYEVSCIPVLNKMALYICNAQSNLCVMGVIEIHIKYRCKIKIPLVKRDMDVFEHKETI